jgi:hypothetical protein
MSRKYSRERGCGQGFFERPRAIPSGTWPSGQSQRRAAHHPAYTPAALPIPDTMNAAIRPNGSPAAQPRLAPTLVPMKMNIFTFGLSKQEAHRRRIHHFPAAAPWAEGTRQLIRIPPPAARTISSLPPHIAAR